METKELNKTVIEKAESIESKYHINYIASGLPRWLIEVAFLCFLLQAVINWTPLMHWMEDHAPLASAIIQTFGALVMYVGLMRGMKPLYRPMTLGWWIVMDGCSLSLFCSDYLADRNRDVTIYDVR